MRRAWVCLRVCVSLTADLMLTGLSRHFLSAFWAPFLPSTVSLAEFSAAKLVDASTGGGISLIAAGAFGAS